MSLLFVQAVYLPLLHTEDTTGRNTSGGSAPKDRVLGTEADDFLRGYGVYCVHCTAQRRGREAISRREGMWEDFMIVDGG